MTEAFVNRSSHCFAVGQFFAYSLENQHVGIDRDTDREHESGKPGQRKYGAESSERRQCVEDVKPQRHDCQRSGEAVVTKHDENDQRESDDAGRDPFVNRVFAEAGADLRHIGNLERHRQRSGSEDQRQVLRRLQILTTHRDLAVRANRALNDRRSTHHALVVDATSE